MLAAQSTIANATGLTYTTATTPDPVQTSTIVSISIVASNCTGSSVTFSELAVKVTPGETGDSLLLNQDVTKIVAIPPANWTVTPDNAGTFTFKPTSGSVTLQPNDALGFELATILVNDTKGTTLLTLTETVNQQAPKTTTVTISKFPNGFVLSPLVVDPPVINPGEQVKLSWRGSRADYRLEYANSEGIQTIDNIPDQNGVALYECPVGGLDETTTFTLLVTAQGGNVNMQRQCVVVVPEPTVLDFGTVGNVAECTTGFILPVYWQTQNATGCDLYVNGFLYSSYDPNIDPTQGTLVRMPFTPGTVELVLRVYDSTGKVAVTATLPILVYQFKPLPSVCVVGPMPFQLVVRSDSRCLLAACGYPRQFGGFDQSITYPAGNHSYLYTISTDDLDNLTTSQLIAQEDAQPYPDTRTQCITRLAANPADAYRFYFFSALGWITDIDTSKTPSTIKLIHPYGVHDDNDIPVGVAGTSRSGEPYPAICYHNGPKITDFFYITSDYKPGSLSGFYLSDQLPALVGIGANDVPNDIWSIAVVPGNVLLSLSIALGSTKSLVRVLVPEKKLQLIKIDNFKTGLFPPSIVFLANDNARGYCVSGIETIQPDPNTPPKDQPVIVAMNGSDKEIRRIPVPAEVRAMVASPDSYHLYATLDNDTVVRISTGAGTTSTGAATQQIIDTIQVGSHPWALAVNPEGTRLYVSDVVDPTVTTNPLNGKVWVVEISDRF